MGRIFGRIFGFQLVLYSFRPDQFRHRSRHRRGVSECKVNSSGREVFTDYCYLFCQIRGLEFWSDLRIFRFLDFSFRFLPGEFRHRSGHPLGVSECLVIL